MKLLQTTFLVDIKFKPSVKCISFNSKYSRMFCWQAAVTTGKVKVMRCYDHFAFYYLLLYPIVFGILNIQK